MSSPGRLASLLTTFVDPWILTSALLVFKVTFVVLATMLLLWAGRHVSAAVRHSWIVATLLGCLALPGLTRVVPSWRIDVESMAVLPEDVPAGADVLSAGAPLEAQAAPTPPPSSERLEATRLMSLYYAAGRSAETYAASRWAGALIWVWMAGAGLFFVLLGTRTMAMCVMVRRSKQLQDATWYATLERLRSQFGVSRRVELRQAGRSRMPCAWGIFRPVILLPVDCEMWSPERREVVLSHELVHLARHDVPTLFLGHLVAALHWFNPLVWWLVGRLAIERELACDDAVLGQGVSPTRYAGHVLEIAATYAGVLRLAPVMADRTRLEGRIVAILDTEKNRRAVRRGTAAGLLALFLCVLAPLSGLAVESENGGTAALQEAMLQVSDTTQFIGHLGKETFSEHEVPGLIADLGDASELTRAASAWALGQTGDTRAVGPLSDALDDGSSMVREWSAHSLRHLHQGTPDQFSSRSAEEPELRAGNSSSTPQENRLRGFIDRLVAGIHGLHDH